MCSLPCNILLIVFMVPTKKRQQVNQILGPWLTFKYYKFIYDLLGKEDESSRSFSSAALLKNIDANTNFTSIENSTSIHSSASAAKFEENISTLDKSDKVYNTSNVVDTKLFSRESDSDTKNSSSFLSNLVVPLYCLECYEEEEDNNELATKVCQTCEGRALCDKCFAFLHKKRKQKDHIVQDLKQTTQPCFELTQSSDENRKEVTHLPTIRSTPLNKSDPDLRQLLANTGKALTSDEPRLFQFMSVVEDEGDSGVVDKVIIVQEEIIRFCTAVSIDSCSASSPSSIDFS